MDAEQRMMAAWNGCEHSVDDTCTDCVLAAIRGAAEAVDKEWRDAVRALFEHEKLWCPLCEEMVPAGVLNHWESCAKHPARERIRAAEAEAYERAAAQCDSGECAKAIRALAQEVSRGE